jgi:glycosyltransferase involved in cell wall biosynthesis
MNRQLSVLIVFNAGANMYGMERAVIESFDLLRPEVKPHFLMSFTTHRIGLPILDQIRSRKLDHSFFSDKTDWPRVGRPKSLLELWRMAIAIIKGNKDVMKASQGKDVIYIPGIPYLYYAAIPVLFHRFFKRRVVLHFHDLLRKPSKILRLAAVFVTDFVHNTQTGCDATLAANPYLKKKNNHIIPCPVRVEYPLTPTKAFEAANDDRQMFFIGQVSLHKGVDILLDAFQMLSKSHEGLVLNVIGGCDDPVLSQRLQNGTAENNCKVKWWGYQNEVMPILKHAYLYVHPSPPSRFHESFGLGLVEAMSLGIPSVCFRSGALEEVMVHGETGLICEDEKPESLAKNIDRLLRDVSLRNSYGEQALKRYRDCYSSVQIKNRWLAALGHNS